MHMLSSFGRCYMAKNESPFKFTFRLSPPQSWLFVLFFAVLPSNFKRPYLFNRLADLGEFYVKSKGFPCSTQKSSDFGRMDEKRGPFFLMWGLFRAKNTRNDTAREHGVRGSRAERDSYAMLSSFGRCYMAKKKSPFKFTFVYRPRKVRLFVPVFRCFALQLQKAISFQPLRPIWVNFMSNQRVFRALRGNRAILEEWTKKEGAFLPHVGPFQG